jgi:hypothetical protein
MLSISLAKNFNRYVQMKYRSYILFDDNDNFKLNCNEITFFYFNKLIICKMF